MLNGKYQIWIYYIIECTAILKQHYIYHKHNRINYQLLMKSNKQMREQTQSTNRSIQKCYYNYNSGSLQMKIRTLTHDYYITELPEQASHSFYKKLSFYLDEKDYKGNRIKVAPVARIYGTNQFGQKCCCHIHGYFPHFYIKAEEYSNAFINDNQFKVQFLSLLEGLYQRAYSVNKPIIMNAFAQQKLDFYGYHEKPETFLKIIVYDPSYILRLRELLDSQIVGGRVFQSYQAHINYFMQLFSDHNIYGINQLTLIQFSFRKNLPAQSMNLFRKLNTQTKKLFKDEGLDIIELQKKHPQFFNQNHKLSGCYIEVDLWMNSILNTFSDQNQIENDSADNKSIDSEIKMDEVKTENKHKFQVKITKALQQIWEDEAKRRQIYGIKLKIEGFVDYSNNIQASHFQNRDRLWINFIKKGNNSQQFIQLIRSSLLGRVKQQIHQIDVCREVASSYSQVLAKQKQRLIEKVLARWKYYGSRKKNYISQLMKGQREEMPEWDDDKNQSSVSDGSDRQQQEGQQAQPVYQTKSQAPKKTLSTAMLYRNNYKHVKANLKKDSYFYICSFCRSPGTSCKCENTKMQTESTQDVSSLQPLQILDYYHNKDKTEKIRFAFNSLPPTFQQVKQDAVTSYQKPFYSNYKDLFSYHKINAIFEPCLRNAQILQRQLKIIKDYNRQPITIKNEQKLPYYFKVNNFEQDEATNKPVEETKYFIKYEVAPPTYEEVLDQHKCQMEKRVHQRRSTSIKPNKDDTFVSDLVVFHYQFLVGFEKNCQRVCGDPQKDQIVSFSFQIRNFLEYRKVYKGLIAIEKYVKKQSLHVWEYEDIFFVKDQYDLLSLLINIIFRVDPDMLVTYDQQKRGIRYLTQRGFHHNINFQQLISRSCQLDNLFQYINFKDYKVVKEMLLTKEVMMAGNIYQIQQKTKKTNSQLAFLEQKLKQSFKKKPVLRQKFRFDIEIKGRVNISLYRICEQHLKLRSYTIQNVYKHLTNQQIPEFTDGDLFKFFTGVSSNKDNCQIKQGQVKKDGVNFALQYLNKRIQIQGQIVENLNIITVLIQKSKIFGSDIVSMMERGSQFKIQSVMCRVTKKLGYLTLSASKRQVGNQSPLQCVALVLEPPKEFFPDPVLLFDFQSLYPSIMIAYNLCFSTCLGNINNLFDKNKLKRLGVSQKMNVDFKFLQDILMQCDDQTAMKRIQNSIFLTPNKVAYVKKDIKQGIIPRILLQFLITRIMIKKSQPLYDKSKIKKILKDRQYALKLFMNVMFGYTGASFTGRMPCSQIADSIVEIAKYLLRQAIDYLNSHPKYKGRVIYGDTDSIFFNLPGYQIKKTFQIGRELAVQITRMFPYPIQMKFQKVYDGLFLVAKKRYYGKMYESQKSAPKYEGKGVECVRRDGISLTQNLMKQMLNSLIDTRDLSILKQIFKQESAKILNNEKLQLQFFMAKQVKLLKYSDKNCPAHGQAAKRLQKFDPMLVPKYGERMKYFVINGGLKPIKQRSIPVFEYLLNKTMSIDFDYYFRKQVLPPLQRVLSSLADLNEWSASIEYRHKLQSSQAHQLQINKKCMHCHGETYFLVCQHCFDKIDQSMQKIEENNQINVQICRQCTGSQFVAQENKCVEWDCQNLWRRRGSDKLMKNIHPELIKLNNAIKQLNL